MDLQHALHDRCLNTHIGTDHHLLCGFAGAVMFVYVLHALNQIG
jgi:hypothetical protein